MTASSLRERGGGGGERESFHFLFRVLREEEEKRRERRGTLSFLSPVYLQRKTHRALPCLASFVSLEFLEKGRSPFYCCFSRFKGRKKSEFEERGEEQIAAWGRRQGRAASVPASRLIEGNSHSISSLSRVACLHFLSSRFFLWFGGVEQHGIINNSKCKIASSFFFSGFLHRRRPDSLSLPPSL